MMKRIAETLLCWATLLTLAAPAIAQSDSLDVAADTISVASDDVTSASGDEAAAPETMPAAKKDSDHHELSYLVPELKGRGYRMSPGSRPFRNRVTFSPAAGQLGSHQLFAIRFGFYPNSWLGYEVALGHNPSESLHALIHTFNVILRYPIPWRLQPYGTLGYGMLTAYPGQAINADPVTKNTLTAGGGLEFYIRDDVAVRGEMRSATVMGQEPNTDGTVAYSYREYTFGFTFYRSLGR